MTRGKQYIEAKDSINIIEFIELIANEKQKYPEASYIISCLWVFLIEKSPFI